MSILGRVLSGACLLLLGVNSLHSGEEKDLRAIIAKGMEARGGGHEAKYKAIILKGSGTFYGLGEGIPFSAEWQVQEQTHFRVAMDIKVMDQMLKYCQVINKNKGWVKFNDQVMAMPDGELKEEQEEMYSRWVATLVPLKDKAFKLSSLGEVHLEGKAAQGVRVSHEGKRDVNLFFDKANGLLVKSESQVKDVKGGGDKEMTQEHFFENFKDFKGTKQATKVIIKRDGKLFVEAEMTDIQLLEMIDETVFAKP